jgi:SAM-dependent methyltransferase
MGFERVACNGCGSSAHRHLFDIQESPDERQPPAWRGNASIPVVRCERCGLVFLNPRYDEERIVALYQDPQMFVGTIDPEGRSRSIMAERAMRVARFADDVKALHRRRSGGRLLDIGCGLGFFLEALGSRYDAVGLEWSAPVVEMTRALPFTIVEHRFPHHPFKAGEFDVVTFHNVLDHLPDPLGALRTAHDLLRPGGLLMLTGVNFGGVVARVYGSRFRLLSPNHLYYFDPQSLKHYADRTGFRLLGLEYPYFRSDVADPLRHGARIIADWWRLRSGRAPQVAPSPPFYGNVMRAFAVRAN